jgi:alpha-beta hydrolase superfamily lysophospholipase
MVPIGSAPGPAAPGVLASAARSPGPRRPGQARPAWPRPRSSVSKTRKDQEGKESTMGTNPTTMPTPVKSGHVPANGVNYYYEVHGQGEPLLLLHGGLGSTGMFGPVLPMLARERQVIAFDLHGHGRTALGERPISFVDMGDDMAVALTSLGYNRVDALGYSMGGGVAFRLAVQHPAMVRRLVLVSVAYSLDGYYPEMRPQQAQVSGAMAEFMKDTPMY